MIPNALAGDPAGLVVIDWSLLVRKAWHVSGVEGVASNVLGRLWRILSDPMPESMVVAVDPERVDEETGSAVRRRTWRDKATEHLPDGQRYKAGRIPKPPELVTIERRMFFVLRALRIPFLLPANPGDEQTYDADDAIATAVRRCRQEGRSVAIMTEDKDLLQCVTTEDPSVPRVVRWWPFLSGAQRDSGEPEEYGDADVMTKLSVEPRQVADYLALVGDSGDNVPGVRGIGPKTAAKLLFDFGSLDAMLERIGGILAEGGALTRHERLVYDQRDQALASRSLVRLWDEAPVRWDPDMQMTGGFDVGELKDQLRGFGFTQMAERLPVFAKKRFQVAA